MAVMRYVEHVADLVGNTPLVRLGPVAAGHRGPGAGQGRVLQPRRQRQGPHRAAHGRGRGGVGRAAARRHDRRADLRQHRCRAGDGRPAQGLPLRVRLPGQGRRGQAQRAQGLRRRGRGLPDRGRPGPPRLLLPHVGPAGRARSTGAWKPNQYANPENPQSHYLRHRPGAVGADRRPDHALRRGDRHRRHDQRHRAATSRRSPAAGCRSIGADPEGSVYSGGTGRPYLVEGVGEDFWPTTYDKDICDRIVAVSDADSFAMTRRLAREEALLVGGSCGMATVAALRVAAELRRRGPRRRGRRAAARRRPRLPRQGLQRRVDGRLRLPAARRRARRSATCCAARTARSRSWCTPTRTRRSPTPCTTCASSRVSQMPVVRAEPPVMAAEVAGVGGRARPARRAVHRPRAAGGPAGAAHVPAAAHDRGGRAARHGDVGASPRRTRRWCWSTASRRAW